MYHIAITGQTLKIRMQQSTARNPLKLYETAKWRARPAGNTAVVVRATCVGAYDSILRLLPTTDDYDPTRRDCFALSTVVQFRRSRVRTCAARRTVIHLKSVVFICVRSAPAAATAGSTRDGSMYRIYRRCIGDTEIIGIESYRIGVYDKLYSPISLVVR